MTPIGRCNATVLHQPRFLKVLLSGLSIEISTTVSFCTPYPRVISRRFWGHELKDKKRRETALKAGEDRAILLGLGMVFRSIMMYFVICITMVRANTVTNADRTQAQANKWLTKNFY